MAKFQLGSNPQCALRLIGLVSLVAVGLLTGCDSAGSSESESESEEFFWTGKWEVISADERASEENNFNTLTKEKFEIHDYEDLDGPDYPECVTWGSYDITNIDGNTISFSGGSSHVNIGSGDFTVDIEGSESEITLTYVEVPSDHEGDEDEVQEGDSVTLQSVDELPEICTD